MRGEPQSTAPLNVAFNAFQLQSSCIKCYLTPIFSFGSTLILGDEWSFHVLSFSKRPRGDDIEMAFKALSTVYKAKNLEKRPTCSQKQPL